MTIYILNGDELSQKDLDTINKYRKLIHHRPKSWNHSTNNHFHDRLIFIVKENGIIKSFGTLRPLEIFLDNTSKKILGIQAVTAIEERKGYGKAIMQSMMKYSDKHNQTIVGFCEPYNTPFYKKCGMFIWENGNSMFSYINDKGEEYSEEGDVIYYPEDVDIKNASENQEKITHLIPHW